VQEYYRTTLISRTIAAVLTPFGQLLGHRLVKEAKAKTKVGATVEQIQHERESEEWQRKVESE
jgi:hypothetical protein